MGLDFSSTTVGILGGMGPAAGVRFQELLIAEFNRAGVVTDAAFPKIIVLSLPLREWDHRGALDKTLVSAQVRQGVSWLESFGAQIVAIPCNSVHEFVDFRVVVDIVGATLEYCRSTEVVGILCSRQTREAKLYERDQNQKYVYLQKQETVDEIIASILAGGRPNIDLYIGGLRRAGARAVVLGCTELSLCSWSFGSVVDSAAALASAVVGRLQSLVAEQTS